MSLLTASKDLRCLGCGHMRLGDYGYFCVQYNLGLDKDKDKMPVRLAKCTIEGEQKVCPRSE